MTAQAVLFDMDGLLLDTETVCLECFVAARRDFSLSDGAEILLKCIGKRSDASDQIILESLADKDSFQPFKQAWTDRIRARLDHAVPLKQGAVQLVQILASKGYLMGVATSTQTALARSHLKQAGLLPYLGGVIGGDLVTHGKPHPEVYHAIARHLGVATGDCIAFEDSETGTRAAVASGATTVQIPDLIAPSADLRDLGHLIAPNLLEGAVKVGLITAADL